MHEMQEDFDARQCREVGVIGPIFTTQNLVIGEWRALSISSLVLPNTSVANPGLCRLLTRVHGVDNVQSQPSSSTLILPYHYVHLLNALRH